MAQSDDKGRERLRQLGTTDVMLLYLASTVGDNVGLRNCSPARGPGLTVRHRQARLQWAQGHLNWNNVRWQNVLFSNESRFCVDHADGRVRVWRRRGDRYADNCVVENNAWGGPSLMLWGAIGHNQVLGPIIFQGLGPGRGNGITAQRYMDQVLHPHVLPFFQAHGNWVFQHDNARPHTARATQDLLQRSGIQTWANIPRAASNTLVRSMIRRCQAVIDANGEPKWFDEEDQDTDDDTVKIIFTLFPGSELTADDVIGRALVERGVVSGLVERARQTYNLQKIWTKSILAALRDDLERAPTHRQLCLGWC
nr:hypothetical protein BaRGS_010473 [Batillaria attramentaria]